MANRRFLIGPPLFKGHNITNGYSTRGLGLVPILVDLSGGMAKTWDGFSAQMGELHGVVGVVRFERGGEGAVV